MFLKKLFPIALASVVLISMTPLKKGPKLPADLDQHGLIFIEYEPIPSMKKRNGAFVKANARLKKQAKAYPFKYTISTFSKCEELRSEGYKYVLDCDMMRSYQNGESLRAKNSMGQTVTMIDEVFILDLETGQKYELYDMGQTAMFMIPYDWRKFMKLVKKEF